jgi:hypothetical protein
VEGVLVKKETRKYYPKNDLYYVKYYDNIKLQKVYGFDRLVKAIENLQVNRVKELLEEKNIKEELDAFLHKTNEYGQTILHCLCEGNIFNYNINSGDNLLKFLCIITLLVTVGNIDIYTQKDIYNNTVYNYAEKRSIMIRIFQMFGK